MTKGKVYYSEYAEAALTIAQENFRQALRKRAAKFAERDGKSEVDDVTVKLAISTIIDPDWIGYEQFIRVEKPRKP